jgi:hypothetical protein
LFERLQPLFKSRSLAKLGEVIHLSWCTMRECQQNTASSTKAKARGQVRRHCRRLQVSCSQRCREEVSCVPKRSRAYDGALNAYTSLRQTLHTGPRPQLKRRPAQQQRRGVQRRGVHGDGLCAAQMAEREARGRKVCGPAPRRHSALDKSPLVLDVGLSSI